MKSIVKSISGRSLAFATLLLVLAVTLAPPAQRYFAQRAQINFYRSQIAVVDATLASARAELANWNDPKYIAAEARVRLHYIFPGERQYVVTGVATKSVPVMESAAPVANQIPVGLPWYSEVIASITSTNVAP
jgi:cell division protein FtsB